MLGSRFLGDPLAGGMPRWKYVSNRFLTGVENLAFGLHLSEYHTGFRAYSRHLLETVPYQLNSDDFVFDQELIAQVVAAGMAGRIGEIAVPTRYFEEASSVGFRRSVVYGLSTLRVVARYTLHRLRLRRSPKLTPGAGRIEPATTEMTEFPYVFEPLQLRHKTLRSRINFGAHTANMAVDGLPGERHIGYYRERALGGAGMIVVEPIPIHRTAVLTRGNFRHNDDSVISAFRRLIDACRDANPDIVMIQQLYHVGQHGDGDNSYAPNWSPSGLPSYHDSRPDR